MLKVSNSSFSYQQKRVLQGINFSLEKGKNLSVLGESGCGKSTLLKLIYGLFDLDDGSISYNNQPILGPKFNLIPGSNFMKFLAQDFDLMPYITVRENVGKFLSNIYKKQKEDRIDELLEMVEMTGYGHVKAQFLSGGQQQRVAIARALALEPEILLLDEPFSQIDTFRKNILRRNLFNYLKEKQISCIIATHDSHDVLAFSDETIILKEGKIIDKGTPRQLFKNPKSKYCASFFGDVNEIPMAYVSLINSNKKSNLVYSFQLRIVEKSKFQVTVKRSYFRGAYYLIESIYEQGTIFFEHNTSIMEHTSCFLEFHSE